MAPMKDQAVVLARLDYSETSQVAVFFTRAHGQHRLLAKGVKRGTKKRFAPGIDLLERGEVVFLPSTRAEGGLGTLIEWRQEDAYLGLRGDLRAWYAAQYGAQITAAMTEQADPHPELFDALVSFLHSLGARGRPIVNVVGYQRALLRAVGLWPDLTRCVACGRPAPSHRAAYCSIRQGGLVCRACRPSCLDARLLDAATLDALRGENDDVPRLEAALKLLDDTIVDTIGRPTLLAGFELT